MQSHERIKKLKSNFASENEKKEEDELEIYYCQTLHAKWYKVWSNDINNIYDSIYYVCIIIKLIKIRL